MLWLFVSSVICCQIVVSKQVRQCRVDTRVCCYFIPKTYNVSKDDNLINTYIHTFDYYFNNLTAAVGWTGTDFWRDVSQHCVWVRFHCLLGDVETSSVRSNTTCLWVDSLWWNHSANCSIDRLCRYIKSSPSVCHIWVKEHRMDEPHRTGPK